MNRHDPHYVVSALPRYRSGMPIHGPRYNGRWERLGYRHVPAVAASVCLRDCDRPGCNRGEAGSTGGDRKALLNAQRVPLETRALMLANIGIAAAHMGAIEEARTALDGALQIMNAVIYDPKKSQEIARLSGEERTKIFKGEPHERALCNMYR